MKLYSDSPTPAMGMLVSGAQQAGITPGRNTPQQGQAGFMGPQQGGGGLMNGGGQPAAGSAGSQIGKSF